MTPSPIILRSGDVASGHYEWTDGAHAVIATENYGRPIAQWAAGTKDNLPDAVLKPVLRNVVIDGRGGVKGRPADNTGQPDRYHGVLINASGALADNVHCFDIPGTAAVFNRPANPRNGQITANDLAEHSLRRLSAYRVYRGFDIRCADGGASDIRVADFRDWGVRFGSAIDFTDVHTWGGAGMGVWIDGHHNRGRGVVCENSTTGLVLRGNANHIDGVRLFACWQTGLVVLGKHNRLTNVHVAADVPTGVQLANQWNTVEGTVAVGGEGTGIAVDNGVGQRIECNLAMYSQPRAKGLVASTPLQCSTLDLVIDGGAVGADFSAGLGECNVIRIRTRGTTTPVVLPSSWPASTEITINGVRQ